jgi:uncharacterized membrane protein YvbJ
MFCIHCGKQIAEDFKFCPHCGKKTDNTPGGAITSDGIHVIEKKGSPFPRGVRVLPLRF